MYRTANHIFDLAALGGENMTRKLLGLGFCALILALGVSAHAQTVNYNFTSPTDLANFYSNVDNNPRPTNFLFGPTAGISDGVGGTAGGGLTSTPDATLVHTGVGFPGQAQAFNLASGATVSTLFRPTTAVAGNTDRPIQLAFINIPNSSFNNDNTVGGALFTPQNTAFIGYRPYLDGRVELQVRPNNGTTANTTLVDATGPDLANNNWYKADLTLTETSPTSNQFNYTIKLTDYGVNGTTPGTVLANLTSSAPITVTGFNGTSGVGDALGFGGVRSVNYAPTFDGFSITGTPVTVNGPFVIPEPSSLALLAGAAMLMVRRRRH
jgi:hypothetical protein